MPFAIVRNDIARVHADAVVNAANTGLQEGGGVCGAIFAAAGRERMRSACDAIGRCPAGGAVVTPAFGLPARWCIHAVGPVWQGGGHGEEQALHSCYQSIFERVLELGARSVAFPLISAGIFGYPQDRALAVAREETRAFLAEHDDVEVTLVVFDRSAVRLGSDLGHAIREYIDDEYVERNPHRRHGATRGSYVARELDALVEAAAPEFFRSDGAAFLAASKHVAPAASAAAAAPAAAGASAGKRGSRAASLEDGELDVLLDHLDASFSETVLALIEAA